MNQLFIPNPSNQTTIKGKMKLKSGFKNRMPPLSTFRLAQRRQATHIDGATPRVCSYTSISLFLNIHFMENEIWLQIKGTVGQQSYEVSDLGRVRSIERTAKIRGHIIQSRILKQHISNTGYMNVSLNHKTKRVSRLVCIAFHPNPENKPEVNRINGIKTDDRAINLEWNTRLENQRHAMVNWLQKSRLKDEDILFIRENYGILGSAKLSQMFGVCKSYIVGVALGKHRKHVGGVKQIKSNWFGDAPKPIIQYSTLNEDFVAEYTSASQCAKKNKWLLPRIREVLLGQRKSYKGFVFRYKNAEHFQTKPKRGLKPKSIKIHRYTKEGEFVDGFYSKSAAAKATSIDRKGVHSVLTGEQKTAGGYVFKLA